MNLSQFNLTTNAGQVTQQCFNWCKSQVENHTASVLHNDIALLSIAVMLNVLSSLAMTKEEYAKYAPAFNLGSAVIIGGYIYLLTVR